MSNKTYDILKWIALVVVPALILLVSGIFELWDIPKGVEIVGTISLFGTFLGTLVGVSGHVYNKTNDGTIVINTTDPDSEVFSLENPTTVEKMRTKTSARFAIRDDS